ncbi:MAG: Mrr restriction system protein [Caldilineaceae bacterium]
MASQPFPSYDTLMQPTLDALRACGGQASNDDIAARVIEAQALPPEVAEHPHGDGGDLTELEYRLMWTRTYLRHVGLIDSPRRGVWALTEAGWQTTSINPSEIVRTVRSQLEAARHAKDGQAPFAIEEVAVSAPKAAGAPDGGGLRSPTPLFPTYSNVRHFLRIFDGVPSDAYQAMAAAIWDQRGNPQEQVDWSSPDEWIGQRLHGDDRTLAQRIWQDSQKQLNPRYTRGCWYFVMKHSLLARSRDGILHISERGRTFLDQPGGKLEAEIDEYEGVLVVLQLVAEQGLARRSALLPAYGEYSRSQTTFQSENVLKTSLYDRLRNLIDRNLVVARGNSYEVTEAGLAHLERYAAPLSGQAKPAANKSPDLFRSALALTEAARAQLQAFLLEMDAFKFEELVKLLLEEMGYENVTTTSPTNDKGVDVVGTIELGISAVREVIQVKRHKGTINRPVLDQLRGSLHRFNAVRGTIITTGRFSKGVEEAAFERGAAPITLIDGEKLLDLLLKNDIGVNKRQVSYYDFAPEKLAQFETERTEQ